MRGLNSGLRHHDSSLVAGQERRLARARETWGGPGPDELLFSRVFWHCVVCQRPLGGEHIWPHGLRPCACGDWHIVCTGCFTSRFASPGSDLDNGRCEVCPDALAVAEAVMG